MSVETAIKNATTTCGEGPHWDDATNLLLYTDINTHEIHRWNPDTGVDEKINLGDTVGFLVPARKGGYILGLGRALVHLDWESKKITHLHEVEQGTKNRFNDGKCDPKGRIFAGTMAEVPSDGDISKMALIGSLYCLDLDGKLQHKLGNIGISNGLAWTEDSKTMFYIDSIPRKVYSFNYDVETGNIGNQRDLIDFGIAPIQELGFPDGMTIDVDGNIWVAGYSSGRVFCFNPKTGKQIKSVQLPALRITSCCFGGKDLDTMYVTCASERASEAETNAYPLAGSVFKITGLGTKGYRATIYEN